LKLTSNGDCIAQLKILGHADPGVQLIGSKSNPNIQTDPDLALEVVEIQKDGQKSLAVRGLQMFAGVRFCKERGTIELGGCNVGVGSRGALLGRALLDLTDVAEVSACVEKSYPNKLGLYRAVVVALLLLVGCSKNNESPETRSVPGYQQFHLGMSAAEAKKHLPPQAELVELSALYKHGRRENDPVYAMRLPSDENIGIGLYFNADKKLVEIDVPVDE
jgi:hypothetical protein